MTLGQSVAMVAPYYNLVFAVICVVLFIKLFSYSSKRFAYVKPWKILFFGFILFIIETVMTILRGLGIIKFHPAIFPAFEMVIVTSFIYMLLLQKQFAKTGKMD
ncbi:TPA: hypothetical protein HA219_03360 [Candidatus Woesearchaeota archaeon]|nr:hypothetical protein [Candidatus Woesearchaeota archaeon]HIH39731.1 hypothetical protein [Candidatus Woesearchaeota archaeon]